MVTSDDPGASTVPRWRNHAAPLRAIKAIWDIVSALCTRAGRRETSSGTDLSVRKVGSARPLSSQLTKADSSPAT